MIAQLKEVRFDGVTALDDKVLQQVATPYLHKPFTNQDLANLKYELTRLFYDKGYSLVRITTPPQDLSDGILDVAVFEAHIDKIEIPDGDKPIIRNWIAEAITKRLEQGDIFREGPVESMVNDFNDLYNVKASVNLKPGHKFSTTDLDLVFLEDKTKTRNYVSIDNYGSELTGDNVGSAHLEKGNLFGIGETFSLDLKKSDDQLWGYGIGTKTPIGFRNITLETYYLRSENGIGDRLESLAASGKTESFDISLSSKILNTRNRQFVLNGGFEIREHESFLDLTPDKKDNIRKAYFATSYLHRTASNVFFSMLKISRGVDMFGASKTGRANATRSLGHNDGWLLQPLLIWNHNPSPAVLNGTLKAILAGQISSHTLLSSDLFALGGYGSIRGFEPVQESGEAGYQFSLEYDQEVTVPFLKGWQTTFGPFIEGGTVYNRIEGSTQDNNLYSAGLSLELSPEPFLSNVTLSLDWASSLGAYTSDQVSDNTFYSKAKLSF